MTTAIVWFAGILASALVTILINDPLKYLVARAVGEYSSARRGLRGIWRGKYNYTSEGEEKVEEHFFLVRQVGKYVVAKTVSQGDAWYKLKGKLDHQSFLTGTWEERTPDGRFYHGAFQLTIIPQGHEMRGRWVGFDRHYNVLGGDWHWSRESGSTSGKVVKRYVAHSGWPDHCSDRAINNEEGSK